MPLALPSSVHQENDFALPRVTHLGPEILGRLEGDHVAVMLYGSCARGDQGDGSDVDVLQLVERWRPSYARGRVSVSVYTCEHLSDLAQAGSLFVLHLVKEGRTIEDRASRLTRILDNYRPPETYDRVLRNLRRAAAVLDVDDVLFGRNPAGFVRVALYLLRTALYVRCAEMGRPVFAMARVAEQLRDPRITSLFAARERATPEYFDQVRSRLLHELGVPGRNEFRTLEALAVALYEECPIASCLALKLLAGHSRIEYDSTFLDWSHSA